jgi:hypothetical protein
MAAEEPPRKRLLTSEEERLISHVGMPSTHIKITSRSTFSSKNFNEILRNMASLSVKCSARLLWCGCAGGILSSSSPAAKNRNKTF